MTTLAPFRLTSAPLAPEATAGPSAPPVQVSWQLGPEDPTTSTKPESFNYDREHGAYPNELGSLAEFDAWCREMELENSIQISKSSTAHSNGPLWSQRRYYVCAQGWSGGKYKYEKKYPDCLRKVESKKSDCKYRIVIKLYPHTQTILGHCEGEHNHGLSEKLNIRYCRLSNVAINQIKSLLEQEVAHKRIVSQQTYLFLPI